MPYYLVSARPVADRLDDLEAKLNEHAFLKLQPFRRALTAALEGARRLPDGTAVWEEEDYCRPPLAEERHAVLDHYFEDVSVELVEHGSGWERIAELPRLFPALR
ncbi:MAG TPA: hypothetical protein VHH32_00875 [Gemmatimonadales bacterium]|nr:hypothetical protein [Gemmatimonadales bacterium]